MPEYRMPLANRKLVEDEGATEKDAVKRGGRKVDVLGRDMLLTIMPLKYLKCSFVFFNSICVYIAFYVICL